MLMTLFFWTINETLYEDFSKLMQTKVEMSMMGEMKIFLGLQIKQTDKEIYINQTKYVKELLKKFNMDYGKEMKTPMHLTTYLGLGKEYKKVDGIQYRGMIGPIGEEKKKD